MTDRSNVPVSLSPGSTSAPEAPRASANMPVTPAPPPPPPAPEEPPPLPPTHFAAMLGAAGRGRPRSLPFWWHLTTQAFEIAHWHHPEYQFQTSSLDFYDRIERAFTEERIPDLRLHRVLWKEAGMLSSDRLYLRVSWKRYVGDICAAPFGRGFFFSFWVFVLPPVISLFHIAGMLTTFCLLGTLAANAARAPLGEILPICLAPAIPLLAIWVRYSRQSVNEEPFTDFAVGLTVLGPFIDVLLRPLTYFQRDTAAMFMGLIEHVFFQHVDAVTEEAGQRPLTDLEKKPQMTEFLGMKRMGRR